MCHREVHFPFGLPITRTVPDMIAYSETICVTARAEIVVKLPEKPRRNNHNSFRKCGGTSAEIYFIYIEINYQFRYNYYIMGLIYLDCVYGGY